MTKYSRNQDSVGNVYIKNIFFVSNVFLFYILPEVVYSIKDLSLHRN